MTTPTVSTSRPPSWRAVLLPREHGGWSLALEPLALGLIAAWSPAGGALALAATAAFLLRRPWQAAIASDAQRPTAILMLSVLGLVAAIALGFGLRHGDGPAGWALLGALPAGAAFAWFDSRKAARELAAELAGAAFFAVGPAAIALAAGRAWPGALVLTGFALARSTTTILTVRTFLRRRRHEPVSAAPAILATIAAGVAFGAYGYTANNWIPCGWTIVFAVRTVWLLGPRAPAWPARQIGVAELLLGAAAIISTGITLR